MWNVLIIVNVILALFSGGLQLQSLSASLDLMWLYSFLQNRNSGALQEVQFENNESLKSSYFWYLFFSLKSSSSWYETDSSSRLDGVKRMIRCLLGSGFHLSTSLNLGIWADRFPRLRRCHPSPSPSSRLVIPRLPLCLSEKKEMRLISWYRGCFHTVSYIQ